jgi:hypothetical protein
MQLFYFCARLHIQKDRLMKKISILLTLVLSSGLAFGQPEQLKSFYSIDVFGPFHIELIASDKEAIELEAFNVKREDLEVEVRRGELHLKLKNRHYMSDWGSHKFKHAQYINTRIYYKQIEEIRASAGATITADETIRSKKFTVIGNMGAEVKLSVVAETMFVKTAMGATVNLNGRADFLEVRAAMGGVLKASRLESKSAYVKANMGSEVSIYASDEVDIDANFGADVRYGGDPSVRHTHRKMGADIRKK